MSENNSVTHDLGAKSLDMSYYEDLYKHFHSHPEMSKQEEKTSERVVARLRELGSYDVHDKIGGYGVAAVLENGSGPKILLRADMDALPVKEQTGLDYASTATGKDSEGKTHPVHHACGHDVHITCLLATAETLLKAQESWSGTLILVFQPAEETGSGADAMVSDGLYKKVPEPDVVLGQHVVPGKAGTIEVRSGPCMAAAESTAVTFHGKGGHASAPHMACDPVLMAAAAVLRIQGIVSREVDTDKDMAVLTVGSLHAGQTENTIPAVAEMKTNIRTYDEGVRDRILASMKRVVRAEAMASGAETDPEFAQISQFPLTVNDPTEFDKVAEAFKKRFGDNFSTERPRHPASEDVSHFATSVDKPLVYWFIGGNDPDTWDKAKKEGTLSKLPNNHSPFFAPVIQPTLTTGIDALCTAAMVYLGKSK